MRTGRIECRSSGQLTREALFRLGMWLKAFEGTLEIVGGVALFAVTPTAIVRVVGFLTQDEITEDPRDVIASSLRRAAHSLTLSEQHFMAAYLLAHGLIKCGLAWALLRRYIPVYPLSMIAFTALVAYQLYRFTLHPQPGLIVLSLLDVVLIVLIYLEYRALSAAQNP